MAANPILSTAVAKGQLDHIDATLGPASKLILYGGTVPDDVDAASGTALATLTASGQMFAAAAGSGGDAQATMGLSATLSGSVSVTGTATYFRLSTNGGTAHVQGTVGTASADLVMASASLTSGDTVDVATLTLRQPTGDDA